MWLGLLAITNIVSFLHNATSILSISLFFFFLMIRPPPSSPLFPSGPLSRSLNLPAVLGGRDRHDGLAQTARDRSRQSGPPRRERGDAGHDGVPVRDPRGVGNPRKIGRAHV